MFIQISKKQTVGKVYSFPRVTKEDLFGLLAMGEGWFYCNESYLLRPGFVNIDIVAHINKFGKLTYEDSSKTTGKKSG